MLHTSFWQRLAIVVSCMLLMTMSLPSMMSPRTVFALANTPTVTIERAFTRDSHGNEKNTFAPGDAIQYAELVTNHNSTSVTPTFLVQSTDPNGNVIFSSKFDLTLPPGLAGVYTPDFVPKGAPPGTYTFQVTVTYNGQSSQGQSRFTVMLVQKTDIWAGYATVASAAHKVTYTSIVGQWQVPSVSCSLGEVSKSAAWIGLGAYLPGGTQLGNYIAQVGTESDCQAGIPVYYAVYQMYDRHNPTGRTILFTISADDAVTATVYYLGNGTYQLNIGSPNKWQWSGNKQGSALDEARYSAEWIVEDPTTDLGFNGLLSQFSPVSFYGCYANSNPIIGGPITVQITMQPSNTSPKAVPSPLDLSGKAFSVTWERS